MESLVEQVKEHTQARKEKTINQYPEDAAGLRILYIETQNAGAKYSDTIIGRRARFTNHEQNVYNLYQNGAQYFKNRYEEALEAEKGGLSSGMYFWSSCSLSEIFLRAKKHVLGALYLRDTSYSPRLPENGMLTPRFVDRGCEGRWGRYWGAAYNHGERSSGRWD